MTARRRDLAKLSDEDKEVLVDRVINELKPRKAIEKQARWFLELLVEQAGLDVVDVASRVFAPRFVSSRSRKAPGPRNKGNKAHAVARQVARRWEAFQRANGGKPPLSGVLGKRFISKLPPDLKDNSLKTIQNIISLGNRLNRQRPTLVRLAATLKRFPSLMDIDGRRISRLAKEMRLDVPDADLKSRLAKAEYIEACAQAVLLGSSVPFTSK
jgi:hypothetical protein